MITGAIKSQIDQIWNAFWSGGISNPIEVIEQITYLLFLRRLGDLHTLEENRSARLKEPLSRRVFPEGKDGIGRKGGRPYDDLRWSRFKPSTEYARSKSQRPFDKAQGRPERSRGASARVDTVVLELLQTRTCGTGSVLCFSCFPRSDC